MIKHVFKIALFFLFIGSLLGSDIQVKTVKSANDLPEEFCTIWKPGDVLLSDGQYLVLFGGVPRPLDSWLLSYPNSNAMGSIIGFAPAGQDVVGNLSIGSPVIKILERREYLTYSSLKPVEEQKKGFATFKASVSYKGKNNQRAEIETIYDFYGQKGQIDIRSTIKNTGETALEDFDYLLHFDPNHRYSYSPFHRTKHPDLNFRIYQKLDHYLGWMNMNPVKPEEEKDEPEPGILAPGEEFTLRYKLLIHDQVNNLLQNIYGMLNRNCESALLYFKDHDRGPVEVVIKDAVSSSVFYRTFQRSMTELEILLPQGVYRVQTHFFPAVVEEFLTVEEGEENTCTLRNPPLEKVKVRIRTSQGEFVPGKVTFIGLDPTQTPYFEPDDPIQNGRRWEQFKNSCFPPEEGLEVKLPLGTYLLTASRGPEYSVDQKVIEVLKEKAQDLIFHIDKVIQTDGLISLDPHLHTNLSDGRISVPERIKSVVAEGVEAAVASDHNTITDYQPALEKLGLNPYLSVTEGNEITTSGVIHYNSYPLHRREEEERNGAIWPLSNEVTPLFEASRKKDPQALLQVNHPRDGDLGYFNNYRLDMDSASFVGPQFSLSFDILEVMNGPYIHSSNEVAIEDWLHLLNRGYYFPIVGSSDTHSIDKQEPGYSRTYVFYQGEKGDNLDRDSLFQALKKGRSFVSNGPLVEFRVNDTHTPGDTMIQGQGNTKISIQVQSAPWISVDEVRIIINGERKIIFPVKADEDSLVKFDDEIELKLKEDSYLAVEVLGNRSLFPILQKQAKEDRYHRANLPYALTNPVFIDVDGDGLFDPPWDKNIEFKSSMPKTRFIDKRY